MPLQNRALPTGEIVSHSARGTMTGNRGIIHGPDRMLGTARWTHKAWICCELEWQGCKRQVMTGRNWTELFSSTRLWQCQRGIAHVGIATAEPMSDLSIRGKPPRVCAQKPLKWTQCCTLPV